MMDAMRFLTADSLTTDSIEPAPLSSSESIILEGYTVEILQSLLFDSFSEVPQSSQAELEEQAEVAFGENECEESQNFDPYQPEHFESCFDCMSSCAIGCTGCGKKLFLKHAHNDGAGGKVTYESSPEGYICVDCMLYHFL